METKKAIALRKSVRGYQAKQIDEQELTCILAAGSAAPVGMGQYDALHVTVVQSEDKLARLTAAASKVMGQDSPFYGAPTVILLSSKEGTDPGIASCNAACAMENMLLAGAELGIGSVIVWSAAPAVQLDSALKAALGIPADYQATLGAAFGYPAVDDRQEKELVMRFGMNRT